MVGVDKALIEIGFWSSVVVFGFCTILMILGYGLAGLLVSGVIATPVLGMYRAISGIYYNLTKEGK